MNAPRERNAAWDGPRARNSARALLLVGVALLAGMGCNSEDPRLPGNLYEEARKMNLEGRGMEARSLMRQLIERYPGTEAAQQAQRDLFLIEAFVNRDVADRQKQVRASLKRVVDALTRYRGKRGEYPSELKNLVPDYLDRIPETPWGHPFLYRPYVLRPIEEIPVKRGPVRQKFNTKFDGYYLASLGIDLLPGGEGLAADLLVKDGQPWGEPTFPPIPQPQPTR
ncbi:hypothetical protein [Geothrix sp. 21YS21S-4]|uniref:hypothetical protein n=1 Tax=Geothrix sp. 21YS21S-4 TaxID=3068889 RepID=UPI0027B92CA3|nr:hypothetical protein [Geothrix sp. 21YS21S-4]